jgi:glycosyltransferase involved in cell wall biosynthesis
MRGAARMSASVMGLGPTVDDITVLIVNYKTPELTRRAVETMLRQYEQVPVVLIDNGSHDSSTRLVHDFASRHGNVSAVINESNRYHGPAMHQGITIAQTKYVFTLDSDCEVIRGGFLEEMLDHFVEDLVYAVGELRYKNRFGYTYEYATSTRIDGDAQPSQRRRIPYAHPYAMLLDRSKYQRLDPFIHHGAPCIKNMRAAKKAGYRVLHYPVGSFVIHHAEGTSARHGYGLRARSRQIVERYLSELEALILRDPLVEIRHERDRASR